MLHAQALGPLELTAEGRVIPLGGRLARRLAAVLILRRNATVFDHALVSALWGDAPPPNATASVHAYVSRLRSNLAHARGALVRVTGGYQLHATADLDLFETSVVDGLRLLETEPSRAATAARIAVNLWRGTPFEDLEPEVLAGERSRLEELHELAVDTLMDAQIRLGSVGEAIVLARPAIERAPYREHRRGLLVLALYRSGRQADALDEVRILKALLADDLGIDPGPDVLQLERRVLTNDPSLLDHPLPGTTPTLVEPADARPAHPRTSFHGRDKVWAATVAAFDSHRLVTFVGPGGVGKTRVAVEWSHRLPPSSTVWFVSLSQVTQGTLVLDAIGRTVGVGSMGPDVAGALAIALTARPGLLVLDNCEHLIADVRAAVESLLSTTPVQILATSRQMLGVEGEAIIDVSPLSWERPDGSNGPAMELLLARMASARGHRALSVQETKDARRLCQVVDGFPLALELAAVRTRSMSIPDIADGISASTEALGDVLAGSLATHPNLHRAVEWSFTLLSRDDQELLTALWPFEGGFDSELAHLIAPDRSPAAVASTLSSLVGKSLVWVDTENGRTRYRLWESVRSYVRNGDTDKDARRRAHFDALRSFVQTTTRKMVSAHSRHAMRSLLLELADIRAMLAYGAARDPVRALESFVALEWFWFRSGLFIEALTLGRTLLVAAPHADADTRARAFLSAAELSYSALDLGGAARSLELAQQELEQSLTESAHVGRLAYFRAAGALLAGEIDEAEGLSRSALTIAQSSGDRLGEISALLQIGAILFANQDVPGGRSSIEIAASTAALHGTPWAAGMASLHLARALLASVPADLAQSENALRVAVSVFLDESDVISLCQALDTAVALMNVKDGSAHAEHLARAVANARRAMGIPSLTVVEDATYGPGEDALTRVRAQAGDWVNRGEVVRG